MKTNSIHKTVETALRSERPRLHTVSPGFTERVIDALPSHPVARIPAASSQRLWPRLVWGAAFAVIALLGWVKFSPREEPPILVQSDHVVPAENLQLPNVTMEQVRALTARIDQPLEKELERVLSDTRNAIQFVASNFMPEN